jgi:hypothetical protein
MRPVSSRGDAEGVELRICFDRTDPPVGHLWRQAEPESGEAGTTPTDFAGWLGLLRALSDLLDDQENISPEP